MPTSNSLHSDSSISPREAWERLKASGKDLYDVHDLISVYPGPRPLSRACLYYRLRKPSFPFKKVRLGKFLMFRRVEVDVYLAKLYGLSSETPKAAQ